MFRSDILDMDAAELARQAQQFIEQQAHAVARDALVAATQRGVYQLAVPRIHVLSPEMDCALLSGVVQCLRRNCGFTVLNVDTQCGFTLHWENAMEEEEKGTNATTCAWQCRQAADAFHTVPSVQVQAQRAIQAGQLTGVRIRVPDGSTSEETEAALRDAGLHFTAVAAGDHYLVDLTPLAAYPA